MSNPEPVARHPAAWLQPLPEGYKIPLWRWILLPATALMLRRNKGVWVNGELHLLPDSVRFVEARMVRSARNPLRTWNISLISIDGIRVHKGIATETIEIEHENRVTKILSARSDDFIARFRKAIEERQAQAGGPES